MIPILFQPGTTDFTTNGLGRLAECTRFEVTEERNGAYECEFDYPLTGKLFAQIIEGAYVYATHDDSKTPQAFEIYTHTAPLEGVVTFRAWHISYKLNNTILRPYTATTCAAALAAMPGNSITDCDFTFWTDKSVTADFKVDVPKSIRSALGGSQGSILDVYGKGDYEFDMFAVKLWTNRGTDRGVSIRYGKNLVSLEQQLDASNQYNGYVPYWQGMDGEVVYLDQAVYGNTQINTEDSLEVRSLEPIQTHTPADILVRYGTTRVIPLDLSSYFETAPTQAQLKARAQSLISRSDAYEVRENIDIDFVQLWQTEEYKNVSNLQRVFLCDTVHIYYEKLGINATAKCIKVVYDTLRERYVSMELGTPTTSLGDQVADMVNTATKGLPSRSTMVDAIQKATELITGGFGGYIKYTYLADGTPSEMLIMDSADEATATNIIRLNKNGLGFSTDGGATYANAWTIDGRLNADFITTGTLNTYLLRAGIITDTLGANSWNLDTGELKTTRGMIGGWDINSTGLFSQPLANGRFAQIYPDGIVYDSGTDPDNMRARSRVDYTGFYIDTYYQADATWEGVLSIEAAAGTNDVTISVGGTEQFYIMNDQIDIGDPDNLVVNIKSPLHANYDLLVNGASEFAGVATFDGQANFESDINISNVVTISANEGTNDFELFVGGVRKIYGMNDWLSLGVTGDLGVTINGDALVVAGDLQVNGNGGNALLIH